MPQYSITGKNKQTGRMRTRVYDARTEVQAISLAEAEGTNIDSIITLPPEPPTDRQLAYAKDLGLQIPTDATKQEVSDLIDRCLNEDAEPDSESLLLAERYEINFTRFTGKRAISLRIFRILNNPGKERELLAWFAFSVSQFLNRKKVHISFKSPDDPFIQRIANELSTEGPVIKSLRRYTESDLGEFGAQIESTEDGLSYRQGTTTRTIAFKRTAEKLDQYTAVFDTSSQQVTIHNPSGVVNLHAQQPRTSMAKAHRTAQPISTRSSQPKATSKPWYKFW